MRINNENKNYNKKAAKKILPEYETIKAASQGDPEAMMEVLDHYGDYIKTLSLRKYYDESGHSVYLVDDYLRKRLEIALTLAVCKFKIL